MRTKFRPMKSCKRGVKEQRYIWAALEIWNKLPDKRRADFRALIGEIADSPEESRALFELLTKEKSPESISGKTMVPVGRLYEMKRDFYDRAQL